MVLIIEPPGLSGWLNLSLCYGVTCAHINWGKIAPMGERANNQRAAARTRKMRARSYRLIRIFLFIILVVVAFVEGFALRGQATFLQSLGFPSSITGLTQDATTEANSGKDVYNSVAMRVAEVEDILAKDSLDTYDVDKVADNALKAFSKASKERIKYYTPETYANLLNSPDVGYAGVGVLFSEQDGQAYAVDVFEESPAQNAGIAKGDFVVAINGDKSQKWSRSEVAAVLSQAEGSTVVITWRRPTSLESEGGEQFTTTLLCSTYDEPNVVTEYDEERTVGYISVKQLTQNSSELVQSAITDLTGRGARAFVLDLRGNPGGYLSQAVDIASSFMESGTVVGVETKDGISTKSASGQPMTSAPLVVITDKDTTAAAEVVAAALKESQRATLVGATTMGKGSVQALHDLSFGGALSYTVAYYLTPEGHDIEGAGVMPEALIDSSGEGDSQKVYAIEVAASRIEE